MSQRPFKASMNQSTISLGELNDAISSWVDSERRPRTREPNMKIEKDKSKYAEEGGETIDFQFYMSSRSLNPRSDNGVHDFFLWNRVLRLQLRTQCMKY